VFRLRKTGEPKGAKLPYEGVSPYEANVFTAGMFIDEASAFCAVTLRGTLCRVLRR
jgi:hypothetical protein